MQINPKEFFVIEKTSSFTGTEPRYRFLSLYNACAGPWTSKERAEEQGREHTRIIKMMHGGE